MGSCVGAGWAGFGEPGVGDGGGGPAEGSVGSSVVVFIDEGVDQGLEFVVGCWLWGLGCQPFLEGLVEAFDFAAGGGVVGSGVLLLDLEGGEAGLEAVAAAAEPANRVV